jgi:hypothetical protein
MKEQKTCKFLRISGEYLESVKQVMNETNRNITGTVAYLISNGFSVYKKERELINQMKEKSYMADN